MGGLTKEVLESGAKIDPEIAAQSCWKNLWGIRGTNGEVRVVVSETCYGALQMFSIAGFSPFGWMEEVLRTCLVPGVPRQILFISANGFLFADQVTTDWTRKSAMQQEWEAYLAGKTFPPGDHAVYELDFEDEAEDPYGETGVSVHG